MSVPSRLNSGHLPLGGYGALITSPLKIILIKLMPDESYSMDFFKSKIIHDIKANFILLPSETTLHVTAFIAECFPPATLISGSRYLTMDTEARVVS